MTMIDLSQYAAQMCTKSHCGCTPTPNKSLVLLAPRLEAMIADRSMPLYYLCVKCGRIAEAGGKQICGPEEER